MQPCMAIDPTSLFQPLLARCASHTRLRVPTCPHTQGFEEGYTARLVPNDHVRFRTVFQPCVDESEACADLMHILTVVGEGVPSHQKMFWTSRKVYMQVEPAYFLIMSAGVLGPDIMKLRLRLSPGFCEIATGAVEKVDWRDYELVGRLLVIMTGGGGNSRQLGRGICWKSEHCLGLHAVAAGRMG